MRNVLLSFGLAGVGCAQAVPAQLRDTGPDILTLVESVYAVCGAELGPAAADITKKHVAEAAAAFSSQSDRKAFVILVCIESRFNSGARSVVGAVGLTQVMPKYAASFIEDCYAPTKPLDLWVPEVNLKVGACQFKKLLAQYSGRYSLALAAYNAGAESNTVKRLRRHEKVNPETAHYIAQFWNIWESTSNETSLPVPVTGVASVGGAR